MESIEAQILQLWGEITAATHRFLELIAEFDDSKRWTGPGMASCAQWLNLHCGIEEVSARERLRVAHAIRGLPKINAAFRDGQVSYSKVRAMTRIAKPENEDILLNIAHHGTASHVERTVRLFRRVERMEEAAAAAESHRQRSVHYRHDDDGSLLIQARVPAEVGELVKKAIERAAELAEAQSCNEPGERDWTYDGFGRRRAEGLRLMAEQFLATADAESSSASGDRYQVVVHIDQRLLSDQPVAAIGAALSEAEDGPVLAVETARRLACDGSLVGIVEDENGHPLNIGRKTRAIPVAIQRALKARDGGCRFPGCTHTRFTEGHHVVHWAEGGETKLGNLVTLCHFHHHLVHEGSYGLERTEAGEFRFSRPDGTQLDDHILIDECFRGNILGELNEKRGIRIGPDTIASRWSGETMDYDIAIGALLAARDRGRVGTSPE
ncbi:MAG TPA: DUF222 domain-containing protein [Gammaproteobacteria bacterium]|nr:DUF222 domain-containing protein [Gammaproteobacteria bacterium]